MIETITTYLGIIAASILCHELGHYLYIKYVVKQDVKFKIRFEKNKEGKKKLIWGCSFDTEGVDRDTQKSIYWVGILGGLVPVIPFIFNDYWFVIFMPYLVFYWFWGCKHDRKEIKKLEVNEND